MAKFAQYYLKYDLSHMFAFENKDERQKLFGALFETNESIEFYTGEGENKKVYNHKVYHLSLNKDVIIMRFANNKNKIVEQNFKEVSVKHEPSCYVIIDNRENCRRISIQKCKDAFNTTDSVSHIITECINNKLQCKHFIGVELRPQYYPKDFYKAWTLRQYNTTKLRFNISDGQLPITFDKTELDDNSIMEFAIKVNEDTKREKYRTVLELYPPENSEILPVDTDSTYIRNLVKFSAQTGSSIDIVTLDGARFKCFIDENEESESIVSNEFDTSLLDTLFDEHTEERDVIELKVLEYINGIKYTVDKDEKLEKEEAA